MATMLTPLTMTGLGVVIMGSSVRSLGAVNSSVHNEYKSNEEEVLMEL